ncbi:hypothetical protein [Pimelobacter simplex]|uniref:hypothetical protein n=1 Tax=Nocardioides simplex TaxID=2045 RepID=UPI00214FB954|nr:hypothetical protein [Pimelobacter simplex]UUW89279.1 hypothetical protein M0M43_26620 [Pimelobacter simplex]UUW93107.1 hypothetical protein M0M48_15270 [Pimelobacter simplex]
MDNARRRLSGFPWPIANDDWDVLLQRYAEAPPLVRDSAVAEVVRSIAASSARSDLRYNTSMWSLIVAPAPGAPSPVDAVRVSTPNYPAVVVEHLANIGGADRIERPPEDAVRLFWRFIKEKYGIEGSRTPWNSSR